MNRPPAQIRAIRGTYAKKNHKEKAPVAVTTEEVGKTVSYGTLAYLSAPKPEPEPELSRDLPLVQRLLARGLQNMMSHEALEIAAWLLERDHGG